jgi:hypothetical protein
MRNARFIPMLVAAIAAGTSADDRPQTVKTSVDATEHPSRSCLHVFWKHCRNCPKSLSIAFSAATPSSGIFMRA